MPDLPDASTIQRKPRRRPRPYGMSKAETFRWYLDRARHDGECLIPDVVPLPNGYPPVNWRNRQYRLHRWALELRIGRELRPGEMACHICHRPACINPDHLYAGNAQDNMNDKMRAGRHVSVVGDDHVHSKLTSAQVTDIRQRYAAGGVLQRELADEYGVSFSHIARVIRGEAWAHI